VISRAQPATKHIASTSKIVSERIGAHRTSGLQAVREFEFE
jgi:hypothetical protein